MLKNNTLYENYTLKQLIEICSKLYNQEKYEEMVNILENITDDVSKENENDNDIASLFFALSVSYDRLGEMTKENIYYEKNIYFLLHFKELLKGEDEFFWNMIVGKSYYELDNLEEALFHLEISFRLKPDDIASTFYLAEVYRLLEQEPKALEQYQHLLKLDVDDEMNEIAKKNINLCLSKLSKPYFQESFKQRVERTWKLFEEQEETIRQLLEQYVSIEDERESEEFYCNELLPIIKSIFTIAVGNFFIRFKKVNKKYHWYFSTMGIFTRIPIYAYFISKMPKSLHQYWNVGVGLPIKDDLKMSINDTVIEGSEFSFWVKEEEEKLSVSIFSEKLVPIIKENEARAYGQMLKLLSETLGEIAVAGLKEFQEVHFELLLQPPKTKSSILSNLFTRGKSSPESQAITLFELKETLEQKGCFISNDLKEYLELAYHCESEPKEMDDDWQFRDDIKYSSSRISKLEWDYENNDSSVFDDFYSMGVIAGFFSLPLETFIENNMVSGEQLEELVQSLLAYIEENAGSDVITIIGNSMGIYCMYIDFIAWDINVVLEMAYNFFREKEFDWANYHSYRVDTTLVNLYNK